LGVLSDAHGNATGLSVCLEFFARASIDEVVFLGDSVGYLPEAERVLEALKQCGAHCLLGNHEAMLLGRLPLLKKRDRIYKLAPTKRDLTEEHQRLLASCLPWRASLVDGRRILFVHGSPWDPLCGYVYPDSDLSSFARVPFDVVFMGHTHRPFLSRIGSQLLVNVGSCGLPRDRGDLASCAVYDVATGECDLVRLRFDAKAVVHEYRGRIHSDVRKCLLRKPRTNVAGRLIEW
jgi:predicted phosphodiesterase